MDEVSPPAAAPAAASQVQLDEELPKRAAGRPGRYEGPREQGAALSDGDWSSTTTRIAVTTE
eukprot:SAG11_NODE_20867_length_436_cov_7.477745_1_plen_62_part_00